MELLMCLNLTPRKERVMSKAEPEIVVEVSCFRCYQTLPSIINNLGEFCTGCGAGKL